MNREQLNALLAAGAARKAALTALPPKRPRKTGAYGSAVQRFIRDNYRQHERLAAAPRGRQLAAWQRALYDLRADVGAGVPAVALVDRIDDELFKLKK